jgi:hypothetical protein
MNDLRDAVDALTLNTRTMVVQWITGLGPMCEGKCPKDREHSHTVHVDHDPLLHQLEAAIASTMTGGGGRAQKFAMNVLDSDALMRFSQIESQIRDWCRLAGVEASRHPADNLRSWYVTRLALHPDERLGDAAAVGILRGWAVTIRSKLDPPRTREILDPCPQCGSDTWVDGEGVTYRHPVSITYRPGEPTDEELDLTALAHASLSTARAECRSCKASWEGSAGIRSLKWEIDQHEAGHLASGLDCGGAA